jgi:ATP-dependent RNA circularization protein (DNA/RNA ligase family)
MLKEDENNSFWKVAKQYHIEEIIRQSGKNLAIQGELAGPGINGNNLSLKDLSLFVFLIRDLDQNKWLSWDELVDFCSKTNYLQPVEELRRMKASELDFNKLQDLADNLRYPGNKPAEGLVVRPVVPVYSNTLQKSWISLKVISQPYAKKYE